MILYLTTSGQLGYILENDFTANSQTYLIDDVDFTTRYKVTCEVSSDQKYVAISGNSLNS